jgi:hypothetical protein
MAGMRTGGKDTSSPFLEWEPLMNNLTQLLNAAASGDAWAANELFEQVYHELRRLAAHKMAREAPGHTLQATALRG